MNWVDNLIEGVGLNAKFIQGVGIFLFAVPVAWDLGKWGLCGLFEKGYVVIYPLGIFCMCLGFVIMASAEAIRRWLVN